MANSLQDALRGAGLAVPEEKRRERRKRRRSRTTEGSRNRGPTPPRHEASAHVEASTSLSAAQSQAARARSQAIARDPWLNGARQAQALRERRERALLEEARKSRLDHAGATRPFHFTRGRRIKRILVTDEQRQALLAGEILIVVLRGESLLLPRAVAEETASRLPDAYVHRIEAEGGGDDVEDPSHSIPDDLVW